MSEFIELNTNLLETNLVNILLLLALLFYINTTSFKTNLAERQKEIEETLDKTEKDLVFAINLYEQVEANLKLRYLYLQEWKNLYEEQKESLVSSKYDNIRANLDEVFKNTENLIENYEINANANLKKQLLLLASGKLLRKFLSLSKEKKSEIMKDILLNMKEDLNLKNDK